jgi:glycerol-3-phosphate acyltransferase PlsY
VDLTKVGSGNIGATNVWRSISPAAGTMVFFLDFLKGYAAIFLVGAGRDLPLQSKPIVVIACAAAVILGHTFSVFLKFKGGKGVATGLGVVFGIAPYNFILCFALGLAIIAMTGYVSLASITGAVFLSMLMFTTGQPLAYAWGILLLAICVIYKHRPNIKRLLNGTENKISWKKT